MKLNWNFIGGEGCNTNNLRGGSMDIFLEMHNTSKPLCKMVTCYGNVSEPWKFRSWGPTLSLATGTCT